VAFCVTGLSLQDAYWAFEDTGRIDHNNGHAMIDFGGQWVMGRMLVEGRGRDLYHRNVQRNLVHRWFPPDDENPDKPTNDAEQLMDWFMGQDTDTVAAESFGAIVLLSEALPQADPMVLNGLLSRAALEQVWQPPPAYGAASTVAPLAAADPLGAAALAVHAQQSWPDDRPRRVATVVVGGPLYPPINSLYFFPMGLMQPRDAYRLNQLANLLLAFLAGLGLRQLARGRVWWPLAAAWVIAFPGFKGTVSLGQNSALTLTIIVWGWLLIARGRPGWGGVVWGLLAFKPVWALAIFLVPLLTQRWRVCLTMIGTGVALALATLPFLGGLPDGVRVWKEWLQVGAEATRFYNIDENWIFLSRDLLSIPRRWMYSFEGPTWSRDPGLLAPAVVGWVFLVLVLELTVRLAVLRPSQARAATGPPAAFLFLAAWLTCFHFMYYDMVLAALPVFLLLTEPARFLRPKLLAIRPLSEAELGAGPATYYGPWVAEDWPPELPSLTARPGNMWVLNSLTLTLIAALFFVEHGLRNIAFKIAASGTFEISWPVGRMWEFRDPHLFATTFKGTPLDTFCLLALWLWCGWLWLWMPREAQRSGLNRAFGRGRVGENGPVHAAEFVELGADVGRPHERLADEHGSHPGGL
jgi:hypothetical protein